MRRSSVLGAVLGFFVLAACGSSSDSSAPAVPVDASTTIPSSGPLKLAGRVMRRDAGTAPTPIAGAEVEVRGDFNADGTVAADEVVKATTDATGAYSLTQELKGKAALVIAVRAKDMLPNFSRRELAPPSTQVLDVELFAGEALEKDGDAFSLPGGSLRIKGLPQEYTGVARRFNPVLEMKAFPGDFADDQGNVLRSGVFSTVELRDANGEAVHQLPSPATLEMEIPRESWRAVMDMKEGTDRIEVPMYTFDETRGKWTAEGQGYLVDAEGKTIPETAAHDIAQRKYVGKVFVVSQVTHFSTTNCDFPKWMPNFMKAVLSCGKCTAEDNSVPTEAQPEKNPKRKFENAKWKPKPTNTESFPLHVGPKGTGDTGTGPLVTGASLTVEMFFPDGTPAGHVSAVVEPDGSFEIPIGQSEAAGEDLDANGLAGELFYARVYANWRGVRFDIIEGTLPALSSHIADLGVVDLWGSRSTASVCEISGTVKSLGGKPVEGTSVGFTWSFGNTMDETTKAVLCGDPSKCNDTAVSGADGSFKLAWPLYDAFGVYGEKLTNNGPVEEWYKGVLYQGGCPAGPVTLVLDQGRIGTAPVLTVQGTEISWAPNVAVLWLGVWGSDMSKKWMIHTENPAGFMGPIQYGTLPAGAIEEGAAQGQVGSGDHVQITGTFITDEGYESIVNGYLEIP